MHQRPLTLYIACSLDGYIARPDGDIDWLASVEAPPEDYGYAAFVATVDTIIMGRKTYEKVLSFGIPWPHAGKKCYVLSRSQQGSNEQVEFYGGDPADLVEQLRKQPGAGIYCDGGAETVDALARRDLIDRYVISVIPVLLGEGIHLFKQGRPQHQLTLLNAVSYPSGLVQLQYERRKA